VDQKRVRRAAQNVVQAKRKADTQSDQALRIRRPIASHRHGGRETFGVVPDPIGAAVVCPDLGVGQTPGLPVRWRP
jgi:hypothetical protein